MLCMWVDDGNDGVTTIVPFPSDAYDNILKRCNDRGTVLASIIDHANVWIRMTTMKSCRRVKNAVDNQKICEGKYYCRARQTSPQSWPEAGVWSQLTEAAKERKRELDMWNEQHAGVRTGGNRHKARRV